MMARTTRPMRLSPRVPPLCRLVPSPMRKALYPPVAARSNVVLGSAPQTARLRSFPFPDWTLPKSSNALPNSSSGALMRCLLPILRLGRARLSSDALRRLGGGKRLRPFLLSSRRGCSASRRRALDAGAALECIHCYSLVHDDLPAMDDDALRRGRPTVHIAFDEATAILAGDALQTLAFEILSGPRRIGPSVRVELRLLAEAAGWQGMAEGRRSTWRRGRDAWREEVAKMQALKTGALFCFACEAGAVLGRADEGARRARLRHRVRPSFSARRRSARCRRRRSCGGKAVAKDAGRGKATLSACSGSSQSGPGLALVDDAGQRLPLRGQGGNAQAGRALRCLKAGLNS